MPTSTDYTSSFFSGIESGSLESARRVVPELMRLFHPTSVVDVGCGTGSWLAAFEENGVVDTLGVDGDYVDPTSLLIPPDRFMSADLCEPLVLQRRFDLVLSLEVAEHLPERFAETYIQNLVSLGDIVIFSAAIPNQTGAGHVNEQWPDYWKAHFKKHDYVVIDCLRHRFWENRDVERWYRQNMLVYAKASVVHASPLLQREYEATQDRILTLVHPASFVSPSVSGLVKLFPKTFARAWRRRFSSAR